MKSHDIQEAELGLKSRSETRMLKHYAMLPPTKSRGHGFHFEILLGLPDQMLMESGKGPMFK